MKPTKPVCEICGKGSDRLFPAIIEGAELNVCESCSKLGKVLLKPKSSSVKAAVHKADIREEVPIEGIVDDYADLIKSVREKAGMTQEEFAKKISERATLIHKIESGHLKPTIELAKKLEKAFKIKLIEIQKIAIVSKSEGSKSASDGITIGDLIKAKENR